MSKKEYWIEYHCPLCRGTVFTVYVLRKLCLYRCMGCGRYLRENELDPVDLPFQG